MKNAVYIGETGCAAFKPDAGQQRVPAAVLLALISLAINLCAGQDIYAARHRRRGKKRRRYPVSP